VGHLAPKPSAQFFQLAFQFLDQNP
jgi:hypothetical protein